jgi:hypothetical protein
MGSGSITRRPIDNEVAPSTLISYTATTTLYSKNSLAIVKHSGGLLDGKIDTVTISDGFIEKILTMVYSGASLAGFTASVRKL